MHTYMIIIIQYLCSFNLLEKDFSSRAQVETVHVPPTTDAHQEFHFSVPIFDDAIEEDDEYFLLLLDVHESDVIEYDDQRMCVKLTIIADGDSKKFTLYYKQATQNYN